MTPKLVLSLWRERWGKTADAPLRFPYKNGKVVEWGSQMAASSIWSVPLMAWLVVALCVALGLFVSTVLLTTNSQYVFSIFIFGLALLLRRYRGTLVTLVLLALALLASSRYLFWRVTGTLVEDFSWDFIFGFLLWAAELHLVVLVGVESVVKIWPVRRAVATLPEDTSEWPSMSIYIPCQGQTSDALVTAAHAALVLDWPREKVQIYLLDDLVRPEVAELAKSLHIHYVGRVPENTTSGELSHAIQQTKGQLLVVLEVGHVPEPDFLRLVAGEFLRDDRLAMLHTARHFLIPPLSPLCQSALKFPDLGGRCAIFRRSALGEDGDGVLSESVMSHAHTALNLDALRFRHACVGLTGKTAFLIDTPFVQSSLVWRSRLEGFRNALRFYYPIAQFFFYAAPAVYLLGEVQLVPVSGEVFAAYALPHLLHGLMLKARVQSPNQIGAWANVRETALSWYVFLYTSLTLTKTEIVTRACRWRERSPEKALPFSWSDHLPFMACAAFLVVSLVVGCGRWWEGPVREHDAMALYLVWNCYYFLSLLANFAVAQEARYIALHQKFMLRVPAAVKLSSGRSLRCMTQNFPQTRLALQLPKGAVVGGDEVERLSLFLGGREFVFPVQADGVTAGVLHVHLPDDKSREYANLLQISRSRGADWPQFLPGENADRPFPPWLTAPIVKLFARVRDFLADLVINWSKKK